MPRPILPHLPLVTRLPRAVAAAGVTVALTAALAGCGSPDITRPRLEGSISPVFAHLYVQQQALLGHPGLTPAAVAAAATCHRGSPTTPGTAGPAVADQGAGSDWACTVTWTDTTGTAQNGKYDVQARSNGCYMASGPAKLVGPLTIATATGTNVINPVFEFDGCFNTT
ncbi:hypothetical protein [Frankia sp. Cas3]|uniref:hypothetical protein n=1 Tax=Frankia sp. Cas3 TaxID=3073926 RepID=UPI002AD20F63|nr:hypothetical protein [Frankia sp. Cas3]